MRERRSYNPKRRLRQTSTSEELTWLVASVRYTGNPEHKRHPGDFGLTPPSDPRPDKSLCDMVGISSRGEAIRLLREGIRRGLISEQRRKDYPQNIWAVTEEGWPLEAQLENADTGAYHGYPMPKTDPFADEILRRWNGS